MAEGIWQTSSSSTDFNMILRIPVKSESRDVTKENSSHRTQKQTTVVPSRRIKRGGNEPLAQMCIQKSTEGWTHIQNSLEMHNIR